MKEFTLDARDSLPLSCAVWEAPNAAATLMIVHGLKGHKERFYDFAAAMQRAGFTVFLSDLRGHGASVNEEFPLGHMDGWEMILDDLTRLCRFARQSCGEPLYLFAHSFGSVLARLALLRGTLQPDKLILAGALPDDKEIPRLLPLLQLYGKMKGRKTASALLQKLGGQKDLSWVNADPAVLENMKKDPLCNGVLTIGAYETFCDSIRALSDPSALSHPQRDLPILFISGKLDPKTGGKKGLSRSTRYLRDAGYQTIRHMVYPNLKHETVNSLDKETVWADIAAFLKE